MSFFRARSFALIQALLGLPVETDFVFAASKAKNKAIGQVTATNLAQTILVNRDFWMNDPPTTLTVAEGQNASVTLTSKIAFATDTQLFFTLVPLGGAVAGVDYAVVASPLVLLAGQTSATLVIPILSDAVVDPNESVRVDWTTVVGL